MSVAGVVADISGLQKGWEENEVDPLTGQGVRAGPLCSITIQNEGPPRHPVPDGGPQPSVTCSSARRVSGPYTPSGSSSMCMYDW
ncbi:hypothetical protein GCM10010272_00990 [Streptomyces lateritius]|nr:hypothetical protein GCM10010272_00990 [Streptomyces lateritius]